MYRIDDHVGIAIAGLTSDARVLRYVHHPNADGSLISMYGGVAATL